MSSFVAEDEVAPFSPTPDGWKEITETITTRSDGVGWLDKTGDQIVADISRLMRKMEKTKWTVPGVTVAAGKTAYATLRNMLPEDIELVKIVECAYLGDNECFAIKNERFRW